MQDDDDVFDPQAYGAAVAERLASEPNLVPLSREPQDIARFADFELSNYVSGRLDEQVDPDALDATLRQHWIARALNDGSSDATYLHRPFAIARRPYWIVDRDERDIIGTIAFRGKPRSHRWSAIEISSVFIRPRYRRQGWMTRILDLIRTAAFAAGIERVSLYTEWSNQDALHFYLQQGMWVHYWKDSIVLYFAKDQPRWHMRVEGNHARFLVEGKQVAVAENLGHRLGWQLADGVSEDLRRSLEATAAVALALRAWPIIRSDGLWQKQIEVGSSDGGSFESFAHAVRRFERYARCMHWSVAPPNPCFAQMPILVGVAEDGRSAFVVLLSDGTKLQVPFETLDLLPTETNPQEQVSVTDDELVYRFSSGAETRENIDHMLCLNQSPEHLEKMTTFYRDMRQRRLEAKQRMKQ